MGRNRSKLVYLVGFMGCGKSTVGELLAREAGRPFIDLDATIEAGQGVTIREIFERDGEHFFRQLEHAALTEASKAGSAIIALGGGTWVQQPNIDFIQSTGGATVWLDCDLEELWRRCEGISNRPLFQSPESFAELFRQRVPYYQLADFRVPAGGAAPGEIVKRILRLNIL
ncbi:MAG: shikimate kinase [Acidobacteriota bacterium]|nr:shikimate kinase [Acidobacteriota bacterium]